MLDIMLNQDGDIRISLTGDISLTQSIRQAILVRLRWIYQEWRLGPQYGFQWFEEVFVKRPDTDKIRQMIRETILSVDGVTGVTVDLVKYDAKVRSLSFSFNCTIGEEMFKEEVTLYG